MKHLRLIGRLLPTIMLVMLGASVALPDTPGRFVHPEATVSYVDLDLGTEAGVRKLYRRLQRASHDVCGSTVLRQVGSLSRLRVNERCYRDSLSTAVDRVENRRLSEIHAERLGVRGQGI